MKKIIKNLVNNIAISTASLNNTLTNSNKNSDLTNDLPPIVQNVNKGGLYDSLLNGVVTDEVEKFRWQFYQILTESEKYLARNKNVKRDVDDSEILYQKSIGNDAYVEQLLNESKNTSEYDVELFKKNLKTRIKSFDGDDSKIEYKIINTIEDTYNDFDLKIGSIYSASNIKEELGIGKIKLNTERFDLKLAESIDFIQIKTNQNGEKVIDLYFNNVLINGEISKNKVKKTIENIVNGSRYDLYIDKISFVTDRYDINTEILKEFNYEDFTFLGGRFFNEYSVISLKSGIFSEDKSVIEKYRRSDVDMMYEKKTPRSGNTLNEKLRF